MRGPRVSPASWPYAGFRDDRRPLARKRHPRARHDRIDLARDQHREAAGLPQASGDLPRLLARAPIDVRARGPDDRRAGVLRDHQAVEGVGAGCRRVRPDEERRPVDVQRVVDRDRAPRGERHALGADGFALIGQAGDPEERERPVLPAHLLETIRIVAQPFADPAGRDLGTRDEVALGQDPAQRHEGMAVVRIVGEAQHDPVLQAHACRSLQLDRQRLAMVLDPADLEATAVERAVEDLAAVVVAHELAVGHFPLRCPAIGKAGTLSVGWRHQVVRTPVDRHPEDAGRNPRSLHDRLVVAGQEPRALAEPRDAQRTEVALEEPPRRLPRERAGGKRPAARLIQGKAHRPRLARRRRGADERPAACAERGEGGRVIVPRPSLERVPRDRLELRLVEAQRLLGEAGGLVGREGPGHGLLGRARQHEQRQKREHGRAAQAAPGWRPPDGGCAAKQGWHRS
ncbi:MAG: hypothetical protein M5U07_05980 [Xanthobacteraceae bacterium]|nr:hypothetical protein [Xanthobacteraceae bacterium]